MTIRITPLLALLLCLPLAACGGQPSQPAGEDGQAQADTALGKKVREATDKARRELAEKNITVSRGSGNKAEITPAGDLLIGGKTIAIDDAQRGLLLQYRAHMVGIAEAGIEVGIEGANLGARAAGEALKGVFSGNAGEIEERIRAEAKKVEESALRICDQLPGMLSLQRQLGESIPEFRPYATMDEDDVEDCHKGRMQLP